MLWLGSKYQLLKLSIKDVPVLSASIRIVDTIREMGVVIDSGLTMSDSDHVTAVCRMTPVIRSCRLDYCNVLLYGISGGLIKWLQSVQNAAAQLVIGAPRPRRDPITPLLKHLHWLPVKQIIDFKLAVLVYKSLHGLAPVGRLSTRHGRGMSTSQVFRRLYMCRPADTSHRLATGVSVAGPRLWNNLLPEIRRRSTKFEHYR